MRIELIFPGKTKEKYLAEGINDFCKRLKRYARVELKSVKERRWNGSESEEKYKEAESTLLLARVTTPSMIVALDRTGKQISSLGLANLLTNWEDQGRRYLSFIIGGPLGLASTTLKKADMTLSFSKMTFTHEMARLLLLEQIYRAYTIKAGTGYHK